MLFDIIPKEGQERVKINIRGGKHDETGTMRRPFDWRRCTDHNTINDEDVDSRDEKALLEQIARLTDAECQIVELRYRTGKLLTYSAT